jgi:hypothetical protein
MKHLKLFEGFFDDMFGFGPIYPEAELIKLKNMEKELEFPTEHDPYLINYYVASIGRIIKHAKQKDLSFLKRFDIDNAIRIYDIVRQRQRVIMDTSSKLERYYNEYKELTK